MAPINVSKVNDFDAKVALQAEWWLQPSISRLLVSEFVLEAIDQIRLITTHHGNLVLKFDLSHVYKADNLLLQQLSNAS